MLATDPLPTDVLVSEATEAEVRRVMARRAALAKKPATHKQRAEMVVWIDHLLDRWLELTCD